MNLFRSASPTPLQELHHETLTNASVRLLIKRDDLIHPTVSGNKWRKLKYVLKDAIDKNAGCIATFGGAYSNHLYATAAAGNELGIQTVGIVRGEELAGSDNPTLRFCTEQGMKLHFVSRQDYKLRDAPGYISQLSQMLENPYWIPEGGTTSLALPGVAEMALEVKAQLDRFPDYFCVAAGTGGTAAGLLSAGANVLAFPALKGGDFLQDDISKLLTDYPEAGKLDLRTDYHFGGYGKLNAELLDFIADFKSRSGIQLEQVYTGKMLFGIFELIRKGYFPPGTLLVAVHTGGLQGLIRK